MGLILLSLLQFVVTAFHYYNRVVLEEINTSGRDLSRFCSVTDRNSVLLGICVFEATLVLSCRSEQLSQMPPESVDVYFSRVASGCAVLPSLWALLLLLVVIVIVGALLFRG